MLTPQVYIAGYEADLSEVDPIVIDYSISELTDPAVRKVSSSKTITLPGTKNNDRIFKQLFVLGKDNNFTTFNPNLKVVAFIQEGGNIVLEGYIQLIDIIVTDNGHKYLAVIYEEGKNLFSEMGDKFLQGNTTSADNVDLETGTTQVLYQYTATEYGKTVANNFVSSSRKGGLFMIDSGTNVTTSAYPYYSVPYTNLRMGLKFKHIWDRIFAKYNTTYDSDFINSTFFKSMVYMDMHKTANLTATQYNNLLSSVNLTSNTAYSSGTNVIVFNNELQDIGGRYNTSTGVYTANSFRDFQIVVNTQIRSRIVFTGNYTSSGTNVVVTLAIQVYKNGVALPGAAAVTQTINVPAGNYVNGYSIEYGMSNMAAYIIPLDITWDAQTGDTIDVRITSSSLSALPVTIQCRSLSGSTATFKPANNSLSSGDVYNKNTVPANQHKQKDFVIDIIRMFNLYLLWDGINYVIEPRDNFYQLGNTWNWTDKVDRTQPLSIKPLGAVNWKQLTFVAKKDADYYSDLYFTNNKEVYGQQNVINGNEFVTGTQKVELSFAPPLSVSSAANYPKLQHMYKLNNGVKEAIDGLPRYGYWAGWVEEGVVSNEITGITAPQTYNGYLFVGEFNNPTTPTLSVLFGPPRQIFYQTFNVLAITDNDLYSNYYSNQAINDTNLNAKVVSVSVKLSSTDINNLKLYDKVIIDGVVFIISKINSYNTFTQEPVEVELIQYEQ